MPRPPISPGAPLLIDKYMRGREVEVDAVFDGDDIMIPGIFEHVDRAGIHSGDSISVFPTQTVSDAMEQRIVDVTEAIARELGIRGLINIQFVIPEGTDELLIIEANPRASRTVPIISKATGINLVSAATRIALGEKLRDMRWGVGLRPKPDYVVVKVPVFSFAKMRGIEKMLGPEMKSTGEVLGIDATYAGALRKGFIGAGVGRIDPEHFAGRFHLGAEHRLDAAHLREREHRDFDHDVVGLRPQPDAPAHVAQLLAERDPRRRGDEVDPGRLRDDRYGPARARVRFDDQQLVGPFRDDELDVDETADAELAGDRLGDVD